MSRERAANRRAAEKCKELTPPHAPPPIYADARDTPLIEFALIRRFRWNKAKGVTATPHLRLGGSPMRRKPGVARAQQSANEG